jgi:hypothetical protein
MLASVGGDLGAKREIRRACATWQDRVIVAEQGRQDIDSLGVRLRRLIKDKLIDLLESWARDS